jgi:CRISPR-associated protein Csm3
VIRRILTITPETNLHPGSGLGFVGLIDSAATRDADGWAYIPGSAIKGRLRSLCKRIAETLKEDYGTVCQTLTNSEVCKTEPICAICRMFGSPYTEGSLFFTDAVLDEATKGSLEPLKRIDLFGGGGQYEVKTGVKLSRTRRLSDAKQLFAFQSVCRDLIFTATIEGTLSENDEHLLQAAVQLLTHIGGQKARGLGRITATLSEEAQ